MTRYFKATDGATTCFRSTANREFASASWKVHPGKHYAGAIAFSAFPADTFVGHHPAVEISKAEFKALNVAKMVRIAAEGQKRRSYNPSDSWVWNGDLPDAGDSQCDDGQGPREDYAIGSGECDLTD